MILFITPVAASGNFFVSASYDGTAKLWRSPECTPLRTLKGHEGRVMSADVNHGADCCLGECLPPTACLDVFSVSVSL